MLLVCLLLLLLLLLAAAAIAVAVVCACTSAFTRCQWVAHIARHSFVLNTQFEAEQQFETEQALRKPLTGTGGSREPPVPHCLSEQ